MRTQFLISLKFLLIMTVVTGIIYPVFLTGIAQVAFPEKSNGSMITKDGTIIGSRLIGQKFDSSAYFWSRPSAVDYNPVPSGASNLGPTSTKLLTLVNERRNTFIAGNNIQDSTSIPAEMLFASGSGLDPHTSVDAARMQVNRIAAVRNFNNSQVQKLNELINQYTQKRQFGLLGEERVNILQLNIELDAIN
jgi:potassium-transporting ATPase KdpC subunit